MSEDDLTQRLRSVAERAKAAPSRIEWLFANQEAVNDALRGIDDEFDSLADSIEAMAQRLSQLSDDSRAGVTAIGTEIGKLRARLDQKVTVLDSKITGQSGLLQRLIAAPKRDRHLADLLTHLEAPGQPQPGLSIFIAAWNHAGFLPGAVASALSCLDELEDNPSHLAGEVLLLDDASLDDTAAVAAGLATSDKRIRVLKPAGNLGLSRARNAMLHAARTTHAFQLDADNLASPAGVAALFDVARWSGAAFTYGNVIRQDEAGQTIGVMSNEPLAAAWFASNYIDSMAVIDLAQIRSLGGFPVDPAFEPIDDWALVHRLVRAGRLIGFVPVVAGRYRVLGSGLNASVGDDRIGADRIARTFNSDSGMSEGSVAAFCGHPLTGPIWASPAALAINPGLAPPAPTTSGSESPPRPKLLVVGPGGVDNLGDDAIVAAALDQLRRYAPDHDIDLLTDGSTIGALGPAVAWIGTLSEAVWGLTDGDFQNASEQVKVARQRVPSAAWPSGMIRLDEYRAAFFLGGGSLTSLWGDTLVAPRAVLAAALRQAKVAYLVSGQGLGPFDAADRALVDELLQGASLASVRDPGSLDELGPGRTATFTGDDALLLTDGGDQQRQRVTQLLIDAGVEGDYLACTVRDADYVGASQEGLEAWAKAVDELAASRGLTVLGVALNDQSPAPEAVTLARLANGSVSRRSPWRVISCEGDPQALAQLMADAKAVAAHSYHAALFGLRAKIPTVLAAANPYYVAKASGLADLAGIDRSALVVEPADVSKLAQHLTDVEIQLNEGAGLGAATDRVANWWQQAVSLLVSS